MTSKVRLIDIGANMCDPMFRGIYNGRNLHPNDTRFVLNRALENGVEKVIFTSGNLEDAAENVRLIRELVMDPRYVGRLGTTCGIHPTMSNAFPRCPDVHLQNINRFIQENGDFIVAFGEFGLDYDRLYYSDKESQIVAFQSQLELSQKFDLPLFLHSRAAQEDFVRIVSRLNTMPLTGVVHSFTGTLSEMEKYIELGFYIGINGCSLKTEYNLEVVRKIPESKILIETDAPWCGIRKSHASFNFVQTKFPEKKKDKWDSNHCVNGRSEPCHIVSVMEVLSAIRNVDIVQLSEKIYSNTLSLFSRL